MTLETLSIEHDGFTVVISTEYDDDAEAVDGYDGEFISFEYRAMKAGIELGTAYIGGSGEQTIAEWIAEDFYHPDLLKECVQEARDNITAINAA